MDMTRSSLALANKPWPNEVRIAAALCACNSIAIWRKVVKQSLFPFAEVLVIDAGSATALRIKNPSDSRSSRRIVRRPYAFYLSPLVVDAMFLGAFGGRKHYGVQQSEIFHGSRA